LGAFFLKTGGNGANVLVEFEKKILTGGIFFLNWGHFFQNWGQKIILGSRKSAFLGIILTPDPWSFSSILSTCLSTFTILEAKLVFESYTSLA